MQTNQKQDSSGNDVDRLLDAALAKYADAAPRDGMEERILVSLRVEQTRESTRSWWHWGLAAAVAAAAVLAIAISLRVGRTDQPVIANRPSMFTRDSSHPAVIPEVEPQGRETTAHVRPARRRLRHPTRPANVVADNPKLDHFPSPQPLSEEEIALARYARSFPKDATMIAEAQAEFDLEAQRQMNDGALQNQSSDSIQQER
ncbi:MAG TPA: hypothetical protein VJQ59_05400 [Candidatus Sulfotelmatobacter sp.]|nr:hypothetical protein [Candidatus Sulfotelmatobacter sp.]